MGLNEYKSKRDFKKTSEPENSQKKEDKDKKIFVIQKHNASSLHYDFRLEVEDVLKSWAVPKGPSTNPSEKRLAVLVEDHPIGYADFEGVIPEGEYGAGEVIVWDNGFYENITGDKDGKKISTKKAIENGLIEVSLNGKKLKGEYALKRMGKWGEKNWLLIKKNDEYANLKINITEKETTSVLSGKKIEDFKK